MASDVFWKEGHQLGGLGELATRLHPVPSRRFLLQKLSFLSRRSSTRASLQLSLSLQMSAPDAWAWTGTCDQHRGSQACPHRRRLRTAEFRRLHQSACRLGSASDADRTFALWISLCRSVLSMPSRPTETIGRTRGRLGRLVRRTDGIRCLPTSTRITNLVRCALSLLPTDPSLWRHGKTKGTGGPPTGYSSSSAKWQLRPNFPNS